MKRGISCLAVGIAMACQAQVQAQGDTDPQWTRVEISNQFFGESAHFADFDKDSDMDVVSPPFWYEGPDWKVSHRFRSGTAITGALDAYTGPWQTETYDFNGYGWMDVLVNMGPCCGTLEWNQNPGNPKTVAANWTAHKIMGTPEEVATYGVAFSQVHNLTLADINGDGILDLVAGKRWGTHGPDQANTAWVVYWFEVKREATGVKITPHLIDDYAGAGTQMVTGDLNGDRKPDVLVAGRRGTYALLNNLSTSSRISPCGFACECHGPRSLFLAWLAPHG